MPWVEMFELIRGTLAISFLYNWLMLVGVGWGRGGSFWTSSPSFPIGVALGVLGASLFYSFGKKEGWKPLSFRLILITFLLSFSFILPRIYLDLPLFLVRVWTGAAGFAGGWLILLWLFWFALPDHRNKRGRMMVGAIFLSTILSFGLRVLFFGKLFRLEQFLMVGSLLITVVVVLTFSLEKRTFIVLPDLLEQLKQLNPSTLCFGFMIAIACSFVYRIFSLYSGGVFLGYRTGLILFLFILLGLGIFVDRVNSNPLALLSFCLFAVGFGLCFLKIISCGSALPPDCCFP